MSYHEPIFAMSLDPAVLLDSQGVVTRVNDTWQPTFGHSADELVGQTLMGLLPRRRPNTSVAGSATSPPTASPGAAYPAPRRKR
ncbi:PAS domain S-box protein [Nannocystis pusilla]|uniref:PAS domain S-box protein n=1 Tax=Nannocystis pusilla TaxID=889268 RepID=UPI003B7E5C67